MKVKAFDALKFIRDTRDEMSEKYPKHPGTQERDLARIRKKYSKIKHTIVNRRLIVAHPNV